MNDRISPCIGYIDAFSGVSGDMLLGSLLHLGLNRNALQDLISSLNIADVEIEVTEKTVQGIGAVSVAVHSPSNQQLRTLPAIETLLRKSPLAPEIISASLQVFKRLAEAEARVHRTTPDRVHFHEVGAIDTIVDIVGVIWGLSELGITRLVCSPLPLSRGFVDCAHGRLPLPAPAVCELLSGVPTYGVDIEQELVTPTGAALVSCLAADFGNLPSMRIQRTGYGAGNHTLPNRQPNLLRLVLGDSTRCEEAQQVEVIETNLDDVNPEFLPYLREQLFGAGALDVSLTPIQMKKGRPGFTLQVIASPATSHQLKDIILNHSSAIGLRFRQEQRRTLPRRIVMVETRWGRVKAKQVETGQETIIRPEYEECRKLAMREQLPLETVYREVEQGRIVQCID